jgi:hypothetical protein
MRGGLKAKRKRKSPMSGSEQLAEKIIGKRQKNCYNLNGSAKVPARFRRK